MSTVRNRTVVGDFDSRTHEEKIEGGALSPESIEEVAYEEAPPEPVDPEPSPEPQVVTVPEPDPNVPEDVEYFVDTNAGNLQNEEE